MTETGMTSITLKWLVSDRDRHGTTRYYVRKPGQAKIRIRGELGSEPFMQAYHDAVERGPVPRVTVARVAEGSFEWLCNSYFASTDFKAELAPISQQTRMRILRNLCKTIGDKPFRRLEARHVAQWMDDRADRPQAANGLLKALKAIFKFAAKRGLVSHNPVKDITKIRTRTMGHHTWTVAEVRQFLERHGPGTTARLAVSILLFTGFRRGDAVQLGRQHISEGWIKFRHGKTKRLVHIPVLPVLQATIDTCPTGDMAFIKTGYGKPYTAFGFGAAMRKWCDEAGLPHCTSHGLRKAGATIAAENGASDRQLMAIFGWSRADMATVYTEEADRRILAGSAMHLLLPRTENEPEKSHLANRWDNQAKKVNENNG